ncbi:ComEA family DNA-binding protein [Agromyces aerolatus]|uniref:ComEA family DNA-binding protein n=1 Tax=Agromyces sp. LY-1074 TaxID=3074080 RepID=UPI00285BBD8D|nr:MULTISPECIES: ComEA family DNA-binding protein [unclassified Agromyces]MDR5700738.1 ComEA family DNA-binding protein [Agromyces sp. LY-1074]MDR5707259.1 ComEA family DNA-binding protein [Agromyces sp. LY-1358]
MHDDETDPLEQLSPAARRAPRGTRVAVGAAIVCFLIAVAVAAVLSSTGGEQGRLIGAPSARAEPGSPGATTGPDASRGGLLVHVLGAVAKPGLVELSEGARVVDAIAAAGGLAAGANPSGVNLARTVADGEQLTVPAVGEAPAAPDGAGAGATGGGGGAAADGLIRLNAATLEDLDTLPRIGPALAQRILDWREANGPFTSVDQLREVAGIGDATFAGLADLVTVG